MHTSIGVWLGMDPYTHVWPVTACLHFANFASFKNLIGWEGRVGGTYKIICEENLKLEFDDDWDIHMSSKMYEEKNLALAFDVILLIISY